MMHGVPPLGGGVRANTMTLKIFNAIEKAYAPPAEAGTPNKRNQFWTIGLWTTICKMSFLEGQG
jgi:hypothetical protein